MASTAEVLPPGVGRIPLWWMEITPHYVLDEEEEAGRREQEDQMAFYYMQLAAADEEGYILPDGTPKLGSDLKPVEWKPLTPWNSSGAGGAGRGGTGPGGRHFKVGHAVVDPKLFGMVESDPDYKAVLTGAKLPPGYFEKMREMVAINDKDQNILNNVKQTDYGRYGRQAEKPNFKPSWAKKKLRGTTIGANIRQGQYDDSPNKHNRRVQPNESMPKIQTETGSTLGAGNPMDSIHAQINQNKYDGDDNVSTEVTVTADGKKKVIRKVRKVRKQGEEGGSHEAGTKSYSHQEYMSNPALSEQEQKLLEQQEKLKRLQELQRQQQLLLLQQKQLEQHQQSDQDDVQRLEEVRRQKELELERKRLLLQQQRAEQQSEEKQRLAEQQALARQQLAEFEAMQKKQQELQLQKQRLVEQQQKQQDLELQKQRLIEQQQNQQDFDDESYEEEIIEEIIDDDSYVSYEEEVIDDDDDDDGELTDLQAVLAAKQAELQRLQAQM
jgi:hypothetical protein